MLNPGANLVQFVSPPSKSLTFRRNRSTKSHREKNPSHSPPNFRILLYLPRRLNIPLQIQGRSSRLQHGTLLSHEDRSIFKTSIGFFFISLRIVQTQCRLIPGRIFASLYIHLDSFRSFIGFLFWNSFRTLGRYIHRIFCSTLTDRSYPKSVDRISGSSHVFLFFRNDPSAGSNHRRSTSLLVCAIVHCIATWRLESFLSVFDYCFSADSRAIDSRKKTERSADGGRRRNPIGRSGSFDFTVSMERNCSRGFSPYYRNGRPTFQMDRDQYDRTSSCSILLFEWKRCLFSRKIF